MRLITIKEEASKAAQHWRKTYFRDGAWVYNSKKETIYYYLLALGDSPTPDAVNEIIGNDSWTATFCHECGKSVEEVVQVGQDPDYDSATASICKPCLITALELIK